jgi:hypothetical protein
MYLNERGLSALMVGWLVTFGFPAWSLAAEGGAGTPTHLSNPEVGAAGAVLYAVNSTDDGLSRIDVATGQSEFIGRLSLTPGVYSGPSAMAIRPQDGKIFVWNNSNGATTTGELLTVNPQSGRATRVNATTPPQGELSALTFVGEELYGLERDLFSIDPETGRKTLIMSLSGYDVLGADAPDDRTVYALTADRKVITVDLAQLRITKTVTLSTNVGTPGSLACDPLTHVVVGSATSLLQGGLLFDVNPNTGKVSNLRSVLHAPQGMDFLAPAPLPLNAALQIEDAPEGVPVNKLVGDTDGPASQTCLDIIVELTTSSAAAKDNIPVTLTIPGDLFGHPSNTWVRLWSNSVRTPVSHVTVSPGRYRVTTDLVPVKTFPFPFPTTFWRHQIIWRFWIPNSLTARDVTVTATVEVPCNNPVRTGTVRLLGRGSADTIVVTNRTLLYQGRPRATVDNLLRLLYTEVQGPPSGHRLGVVYYVDVYSAAALAWNNTTVNYTSETTANVVADGIDELIEDWTDDATKYRAIIGPILPIPTSPIPISMVVARPECLLLVGDDNTIPFYRYNDPFDGEQDWSVNSNTNPVIHATDKDFFFTDNPYADVREDDWQKGDLELAVGRILGDSAADMVQLFREGVNRSNGRRGGVVMASVDGWELGLEPHVGGGQPDLCDVASLWRNRGFAVRNDDTPGTEVRTIDIPWNPWVGTHTGANNAIALTDTTQNWIAGSLVDAVVRDVTDLSRGCITANTSTRVTAALHGGMDNNWDTGDLYRILAYEGSVAQWITEFRSAANDSHGMDLFFIGGHDGYDAAYSSCLAVYRPSDTPGNYTRFGMDHPIGMIVGCHGGLPVPDIDVAGGADHSMVYDLIHEGARAYIGASGFSYGSPDNLHNCLWGERLMQKFFQKLLEPGVDESLSIGSALARAKRDYVFGAGADDALDRKTVTEYNLFGVPWATVTYPTPLLPVQPPVLRVPVIVKPGPIVRTPRGSVYTRTFQVEVPDYNTVEVQQDNLTYDLISIPGGDLAIADGLPILPCVQVVSLPMPEQARITALQIVEPNILALGKHNIPIARVLPFSEGGLLYTTETKIDYLFPREQDLVQSQETSAGTTLTLLPVRYHPGTNETILYRQLTIEVTYEAPVTVSISDFITDKRDYVPGESITAKARVSNIAEAEITLIADITVTDAFGRMVAAHSYKDFTVRSGDSFDLLLDWGDHLRDGVYTVELIVSSGAGVVGAVSTRITIGSGSIASVDVPAGKDVVEVVVNNPGSRILRGELMVVVRDKVTGTSVTLPTQDVGIPAGSDLTVAFPWQPDESGSGQYHITATMTVTDDSYGADSASFSTDVDIDLVTEPE